MSLQHIGKSTLRTVKNYTKGYSDVQAKVRDATSNDPWGPSGTQMNELAQMTYNQNDFVEIMEMLDKRLNDKGKNWRHVWKSLTVLDYLLHAGSENVVIYFRDNLYIIKTLKEFQFVDEYGKDEGANVRQKAKDITNLLQDEGRLREERRTRASMRDRLSRGRPGNEDDENLGRRQTYRPPNGHPPREDDELRRAIELSKRTLQEEQSQSGHLTAEEMDLQKALKLSEEEEAKRTKAVEDANSRSLFDDNAQLPPTGTNPFPLVDTSANPQLNGLQPQFTQIAPQFTSFNPYAQQAQQEALQMEYLRQQQAWEAQQAQQQAEQMAQFQAQQQAQFQAQQQAQQLAQLQAQQQAQQEEWMRQQQLLQFQQQQAALQQQQQQQFLFAQQQQQLQPQPTGFGSNNPFALGQPQQQVPPVPQPPASVPPQPQHPTAFSAPSPPPQPASAPPRNNQNDERFAHLASLFDGRGEGGVDTFGNTGELRYGQQTGRVGTNKTGHNPFHQQQQQNDQPFFSI
ncbi:ENTH-domain-containing protein [Auricularia subglabra TFB-10046 SS5]|nr:ENTH-domain-containing protein [Auricularia subglabra TFB-10046 SS5]